MGGRAAMLVVVWLGRGLRAVPDHPLQTALLNSAGRGFVHICWTTWHLVETGWGGGTSTFSLLFGLK